MERDTQRLLGCLLGEVYRLQKRVDPAMCRATDAEIYALLSGFESIVQEKLDQIGEVTIDQECQMWDIAEEYGLSEPKRLAGLRGFYDVEYELGHAGVNRKTAARVLKYFQARGLYPAFIEKLDSEHSPPELRRFELEPTER